MSSATEKLEAFKEEKREGVITLLEKTLPEKVLELNELLASDKLSIQRVDSIHTPLEVEPLVLAPGGAGDSSGGTASSSAVSSVADVTNRFIQWNALHMVVPPGGRVPCNPDLTELFQRVSRLQFELLQQTAAVKTAIIYLMPKVEDGNNFGVEIQEETVKMIKEIESDLGSLWRDTFYSDYCKDRASFASAICKDPHLDDNRLGLRQLDESAFLTLVHVVTFIRDAYAKMHDVISKNIDKIRKPRTSNAASLF